MRHIVCEGSEASSPPTAAVSRRDDASSHDALSLSHTTRVYKGEGEGEGERARTEDESPSLLVSQARLASLSRLSSISSLARSVCSCPRERARKQIKDQMANKWQQVELVQDWLDFC